ncbi:MAG: helicase, partial [Vicinamibacteria bacterium]
MGADAKAQHWAWWPEAREAVRILVEKDLWGRRISEVLRSSSSGGVVLVPSDDLRDVESHPWTRDEIVWRAAAGRALHLMAGGALGVAGRFQLEPLPHQLRVVDRAVSKSSVRLLLADEVGLGKTIEAGLIYAELKTRGLARRVLVVAPKGV